LSFSSSARPNVTTLLSVELEQPNFEFKPPKDRRPIIPEPPPVKLVAVEDMTLTTAAADVGKLDAFYVELLRFERESASAIVYKAENARLRFELSEDAGPRDDMRAVGIDVPSLRDLELLLVDREIPFVKERGLFVGQMTFLLRDPAGNWVRIGEVVRII